MITDKREVTIRLFFNLANGCYYLQIDLCLCPIRENLALAIKEREELNVIQADGIKAMQEICNKD